MVFHSNIANGLRGRVGASQLLKFDQYQQIKTMNQDNVQLLNQEQVRVLACLMEKHLATPKNYPLTPNSMTLAVNQKSNRHPVMAMDQGRVVSTAHQLNELGFVSIDHGERIAKYSHRAPGKFDITREAQAVLAMLMLREPLTLNDIKARTEKMIGFDSVDAVEAVVEELITRNPALVIPLPVVAGQREQRYTHLIAGEPDLSAVVYKEAKVSNAARGSQVDKIAELESRIERLEKALDLVWNGAAD